MQASTAKNETRLPRAVLKVSDSIKAHIAARNETKTPDPAETTPPAPAPSTVDAKPADADPTAAPPAAPVDKRENDLEYWKHRFKVTEGVLKVERQARRDDADRLNQQITELQEQIRSAKATAPSAEVDISGLLTADQIEMLGEDEAKAVAKAAMAAAQRVAKEAIDAEIKPLKDDAARKAQREVEDRKTKFLDKLTELVPNYADIDKPETGFHDWLAAEDEATGYTRQQLLDGHVNAGNATRVAAMFRAFQKTKERPVPPVTPSGTGANSGNTPPTPDGKSLMPPDAAEIKAFYARTHTKRGQVGFITDQERTEFEARLKLRAPR